jgi:hypothetical protein
MTSGIVFVGEASTAGKRVLQFYMTDEKKTVDDLERAGAVM